MSDVEVLKFSPLELRADRVGPFRGATPERVEITRIEHQHAGSITPSKMFLLLADNAAGKTTLLEMAAWLWSLMDPTALPPVWLTEAPSRLGQLDVRLDLRVDDEEHRVILSLVDIPDLIDLRLYGGDELVAIGATTQLCFGLVGREARLPFGYDAPLIAAFVRTVAVATARGELMDASAFRPTENLPSLLYFTDSRGLSRPQGKRSVEPPSNVGYQCVHRFDGDANWHVSLDAMMVWLTWRDESAFGRTRDEINRIVLDQLRKPMRRIDKANLCVQIGEGRASHRLDQLSSGERGLVELFLRIGVHMTRHTWVLIDELDLHLHPEWESSAVEMLKRLVLGDGLAQDRNGASEADVRVVFTTHSKDAMKAFDVERDEPGLAKAAHRIVREG